ncbi:hypothetical protein VTK26DRAFT_261 [Humicola hyalothermophila]
MSSNEKQNPGNPAAHQSQQPQFPPPPPGPPPAQVPKHSNETPLPDYDIPAYDPAHPQFAPPPTTADDIYDATPTDEKPPKFPFGSHHHNKDDNDEEGSKKKSNRLSAFGSAFASKVAGPVNALAHKFGAEGFVPESLDKECEKAARILRSFCKDGIYSDPATPPTAPKTTGDATSAAPPTAARPTTPNTKKPRVLLTIPSKVISRAVGLAIFTAVRVGFQASGSSGSGILIARLPDGRGWSPPSGIQITSIGAGFVAGVDIYDCVIVINTREALEMFTKTRLSLGSDLSVTAGPVGVGGALDWGVPSSQVKGKAAEGSSSAAHAPLPQQAPLTADRTHFQTPPVPEVEQLEPDDPERAKLEAANAKLDPINRKPGPFRDAIRKPVYSYVKSRGLYAGIGIDGTVVAQRDNANARFYGQPVSVDKILRGEVPAQGPPGMWPAAAKGLFEVLRGAEGWRGQQQQGERPATPPATFPAAAGAGAGAPHSSSAWAPPPPFPPSSSSATTTVAGAAAGPSTSTATAAAADYKFAPPPPPPGAPPSAAASAKAAEAAAEAARAAAEMDEDGPPMYSEMQGDPAHDLPPAYVEEEDERGRFTGGGDSKTGLGQGDGPGGAGGAGGGK